jgi:hypothetical protein
MKILQGMFRLAALSALSTAVYGCATTAPQAAAASDQAADQAASQQVSQGQNNDDRECQTDMETGSRIRSHTVCMSDVDRATMSHSMDSYRSQGGGPSASASTGR